jgi:hypothetical protein
MGPQGGLAVLRFHEPQGKLVDRDPARGSTLRPPDAKEVKWAMRRAVAERDFAFEAKAVALGADHRYPCGSLGWVASFFWRLGAPDRYAVVQRIQNFRAGPPSGPTLDC